LGPRHLAGPNDLMVESEVACDAEREGPVPLRVAGAVGGDAEGVRPEHVGGGPREIRAVHAAAIRYDERREVPQDAVEGRLLVVEAGHASEQARLARQRRARHSSRSSLESSSSMSSASSSSKSSSASSSSSSSSSSTDSSSTGAMPVTSRFDPQSGQLIR